MSGKLKDLEKRLKHEPGNLGLKVTVAGLMREAGRSTEAVEIYRSVALAYRDQGRKQQAVAVCRSILEIAPDDVRCNALLSQLTAPEPSAQAETPSQPPAPHSSVPSLPRSPTPHPSVPSLPRTQTSDSGATPSRRPSAPSRITSSPPRMPIAAPAEPPSEPPEPLIVPSRTPTGRSHAPSGRALMPSSPPSRTPSVPPSRTPSAPPSRPSSPPARTGSSPPRALVPPRKVTIPPRAATDAGTPPPMASRAPAEAPPPPAAAARLPLEPPARRSSGQTQSPDGPTRRSSMEETPLPRPVPHHLYDRTSRSTLPDLEELDTNPDAQRPGTPTDNGLAEAARKITGLINRDDDVAQPMDTRPVRRIREEDLRRLGMPPPTGEHSRLSDEDIVTRPQEALTKPGHSDDDELTTPRDLLDPDDR